MTRQTDPGKGRLALILLSILFPLSAPAAPELMPYTVQAGDTCPKIAKTIYGDARRIDLIHQNNSLGPPPHHLRPGQVLRLPPAAHRDAAPDAVLTFVRNQVEAYTPDLHPGHKNDPLLRGHKVSTLNASSAEITFGDETQLQLGERSLVVILGSGSGEVTRHATAEDTTLLRGTLRAHLAELAGGPPKAPVALQTPAGKVKLGPGEAQVHVDERRSTRVAVYRGNSRLHAAGKEITVAAGFGSRADEGKPPMPPHALPPAPSWTQAPPALVLLSGEPRTVSAEYAPGGAAAGYHQQVAKDERFNDLVLDLRVDGATTHLDLKAPDQGTYFARVSAIDNDQFEGTAGPVAKLLVSRLAMRPAEPKRRAAVTVPVGVICELDREAPQAPRSIDREAPQAPRSIDREAPQAGAGSLALSPGRGHVLRCSAAGDAASGGAGTPAESVEVRIPAEQAGPMVGVVAPGPARFLQAGTGQRELTLRLRDAEGKPLSGLRLDGSAGPAATLGLIGETTEPGAYRTRLSWQPGTETLALRFRTADGQLVESTLPREAAPVVKRSAPRPPRLGLELGLHAGASVDVEQGHPGGLIGLELGLRTRLPAGSLWIALRAGYEGQSFDTGVLEARDLLTVSLPIGYRFFPHGSRGNLYLAANPALLVGWSHVRATRSETVVAEHFGLGGLLGAQVRLGIGALFLEGGYRHVFQQQRVMGDSTLDALTFALGYCLFF